MLKEFEKLKHKMLLKVQQGFERLLAVPEAGRSKDWMRQEKRQQTARLTKEPLTRLRFLTFEEEQKLLAASKESLRTIILVGINAGLRMKSEALTLDWGDIDLRCNQLTVQSDACEERREQNNTSEQRPERGLEQVEKGFCWRRTSFPESQGRCFPEHQEHPHSIYNGVPAC
jgi:hypothetical protein